MAQPILHLSLPVHNLIEAGSFYVDVLGCQRGRVRDGWMDVWFYGMQVTLHERPEQVLPTEFRGVRHFGVTLDAAQFHALVARLESRSIPWLSPPTTQYGDTPRSQTKAMILDPSGNAIELKAYADPSAAFEKSETTPR